MEEEDTTRNVYVTSCSSSKSVALQGTPIVALIDAGHVFDATRIPLATVADASVDATFAGATVAATTYYRWAYGYEWTVEFNHGHVGKF